MSKKLLAAEIRAAGRGPAEKLLDEALTESLDDIWEMYSDKGALSPRLQYLYAKRQAIDFWLALHFRDVDVDEVVKESLSQISKNLQAMRDGIDDGKGSGDLPQLESQLQLAGGYAVGDLGAKVGVGPGSTHPAGWPW